MYCKSCGEHMNDNQAICLKCGVPAGKGKGFCPNCGNATHEEAVICVKCGISLTNTEKPDVTNIQRRSIVSAIILSLLTCGIYSIFWYISLTNEINKASGRTNDTNGTTCFLLGLVTCGIYNIYWAYKMGEKRDAIAKDQDSSNMIYLILMLCGLGIIIYGLLQDTLNKAIDNK